MRVHVRRAQARGTVGHPYSALNLRLALAIFGLVSFTALAVVLFVWDLPAWGIACAVVAAIAAVNIAVVQRRRMQRKQEQPGVKHSLFE